MRRAPATPPGGMNAWWWCWTAWVRSTASPLARARWPARVPPQAERRPFHWPAVLAAHASPGLRLQERRLEDHGPRPDGDPARYRSLMRTSPEMGRFASHPGPQHNPGRARVHRAVRVFRRETRSPRATRAPRSGTSVATNSGGLQECLNRAHRSHRTGFAERTGLRRLAMAATGSTARRTGSSSTGSSTKSTCSLRWATTGRPSGRRCFRRQSGRGPQSPDDGPLLGPDYDWDRPTPR